MTGTRASTRAGLAALAMVVVGLAVAWGRFRGQRPASTASHTPLTSSAAGAGAPSVASPVIELDTHGNLLKISHTDPNGRIPLEYVNTPTGTLTIRRTFDASGRLLKEEAFRGNQPVPMPPAAPKPAPAPPPPSTNAPPPPSSASSKGTIWERQFGAPAQYF